MVVRLNFFNPLLVILKKINTFAFRNLKQDFKEEKQDVFNNGEEEGNLQEVRQIRG